MQLNNPLVLKIRGKIEGILVTLCTKEASVDEKTMANLLSQFQNELFLSQIIESSTHKDGNILDLIITNNTHMCHSYFCIPTALSISRHYRLEVKTTQLLSTSNQNPNKTLHKSREGFTKLNSFNEYIDWDAVNASLAGQNWHREFKGLSTVDILSKFYAICYDSVKEYVPLKKLQKQSKISSQENEKI